MSKEKETKATVANANRVLGSMSLTSICVPHNAQLCESNGKVLCHPPTAQRTLRSPIDSDVPTSSAQTVFLSPCSVAAHTQCVTVRARDSPTIAVLYIVPVLSASHVGAGKQGVWEQSTRHVLAGVKGHLEVFRPELKQRSCVLVVSQIQGPPIMPVTWTAAQRADSPSYRPESNLQQCSLHQSSTCHHHVTECYHSNYYITLFIIS